MDFLSSFIQTTVYWNGISNSTMTHLLADPIAKYSSFFCPFTLMAIQLQLVPLPHTDCHQHFVYHKLSSSVVQHYTAISPIILRIHSNVLVNLPSAQLLWTLQLIVTIPSTVHYSFGVSEPSDLFIVRLPPCSVRGSLLHGLPIFGASVSRAIAHRSNLEIRGVQFIDSAFCCHARVRIRGALSFI